MSKKNSTLVGVLMDSGDFTMSENNLTINEAKEALDGARAAVEEFLNVRVRPLVFNRFEDASFYYREKAVASTGAALDKAIECNDEMAEVELYKMLYDLLTETLTIEERQKLFGECFEPVAGLLTSDVAKGLLYYYLGHVSQDMGLSSSAAYYEKAVLLDNENVLAEPIFKQNPQLAYSWLERYIADPGKLDRAGEYETLLNGLVESKTDAGEYYYKMGNLLKPISPERADSYYSKCIRLGYKAVIEDKSFCTEKFEDSFMDCCDRLMSRGTADIAKDLSLAFLWNANSAGACSKSKRWFSEKKAEQDFVGACKYYALFADEGFGWADAWLLGHIEEGPVQMSMSDRSIERWFEQKNKEIECALGALFVNGRATYLGNDRKYHVCVSRYRWKKGEICASVASFFQIANKIDAAPSDYAGFERDLCSGVRQNYSEMITEVVQKHGLFGSVSLLPVETNAYQKFADKKINACSALSLYFTANQLNEKLIRGHQDSPNCARYLLLKYMADFVKNSGDEIARRQEGAFREWAARELLDAIRDGDAMALLLWIEEGVFSDKRDLQRSAIAALCKLIQTVPPKKMPVAYLLLAQVWTHMRVDDDIVPQILSWILDKQDDLEWWKSEHCLDEVVKKTFELLYSLTKFVSIKYKG